MYRKLKKLCFSFDNPLTNTTLVTLDPSPPLM